ncbi:uncharacterized protein PV06_06129 [Exophiala oligosperma]|uniref:Uncharacterized protein n=1 Tax=Exophiala oligosperma TaxID=215243 RepID=A0A0D2BYR1_9EURO|nr:uncharacterized protein PV06_06129 [Exophiala oligosperma]KIW42597.1 hypothetical protein PV06_06129 [Exophiala oligosperma]
MRFARQRSDKAIEVVGREPEARRRNRLSKPLTNKLATSISTTTLPEPAPKPWNISTAEVRSGGPLSSHPSTAALRQQIRTDVFGSPSESPSKHSKNDSAWSVAYMVKEAEHAPVEEPGTLQQEEQPPSPVKPKKRKSLILRRLSTQRSTSIRSSTSSGRLNSLNDEAAAVSTPASSLDRIVDGPSIPPTRRASFTPGAATRKASRALKEEQIDEVATPEETEVCHVGTDYFEWQPPACPAILGRVGTPADLNYSHLAGFRHGSLQVVNGRASPAISEMSKVSRHLLSAPKANRDVSSDYGDADDELPTIVGIDSHLPLHSASRTKSERHYLSRESHKPEEHQTTIRIVTEAEPVPTKDADQTSLMAREYMAELPDSPFSELNSDSSPGSLRKTKSEGLLRTFSSSSSLVASPPIDKPPSARSPSPTGSVIYKPRHGEDGERDLNNVTPWYPSTQFVDEGIQSVAGSEAQTSRARLQPPPAPEKSDSGYSSSTSLKSLQRERKSVPGADGQALQVEPTCTANTQDERREANPLRFSHRPSILKSRKTAPQLPTLADVRPAEVALTPLPAAPELGAIKAKPVKTRKKLQKKRTLSQPPPQVSIGRVHSFEGQSIPSVPREASEALRLRSEIVPELDNTYLRETSIASFGQQESEIRFPSPAPEPPVEIKRSRSLSRPRSWIGRSKEDKTPSRRHSLLSQHEDNTAILYDLGTVASSLGGSPYDLAHENIVSEQTMNPYNISTVAPRPRYMMDDRTAAELSRSRSRPVHERDGRLTSRKPSFNDRGGVPGRNIRPASFASDAPPITAEMLQNQRLASLSSVSAVPPPPPPHARRPSYVDYEEDLSDRAFALPPPSHSPRPIDTCQYQWPLHATAGETRGQSVGDALREQSWKSRPSQDYYEDYQDPGYDETLYHVLSPPDNQGQGWGQYMDSTELDISNQDRHRDGYTTYKQTNYNYSAYAHEVPYVYKSRHYSMMQDCPYSYDGADDFSDSMYQKPHRYINPRGLGSRSRSYGAYSLGIPDQDNSYSTYGQHFQETAYDYQRGNSYRSLRVREV